MLEMIPTETIYEQYSSAMYRYALKLSHDEDTAKQITADAFAAVTEKLSIDSNAIQNVRSYLYQTVYHMVIDLVRENDRIAPLEVAMDNVDEFPSLEVAVDLRELLPWAKDWLSVRQYECFELCLVKGYKTHQAAEILGVTPNNVKVSISRSRKKLREIYKSYGLALKQKPEPKPEQVAVKKHLTFLRYAFTNHRILENKYAGGRRFDWQLTEQEFLVAFGYPRNMTEAAEKFFREYHRELIHMARVKGLLPEGKEVARNK